MLVHGRISERDGDGKFENTRELFVGVVATEHGADTAEAGLDKPCVGPTMTDRRTADTRFFFELRLKEKADVGRPATVEAGEPTPEIGVEFAARLCRHCAAARAATSAALHPLAKDRGDKATPAPTVSAHPSFFSAALTPNSKACFLRKFAFLSSSSSEELLSKSFGSCDGLVNFAAARAAITSGDKSGPIESPQARRLIPDKRLGSVPTDNLAFTFTLDLRRPPGGDRLSRNRPAGIVADACDALVS